MRQARFAGAVIAIGLSMQFVHGDDCWCPTPVSCCGQITLFSPICTFNNTTDTDGDGVNDLCETEVLNPGLAIHPRKVCAEGWSSELQAWRGSTAHPNTSCRVLQGVCVVLAPFSPTTVCVRVDVRLDCQDWIRNDPGTDPDAQYDCVR